MDTALARRGTVTVDAKLSRSVPRLWIDTMIGVVGEVRGPTAQFNVTVFPGGIIGMDFVGVSNHA